MNIAKKFKNKYFEEHLPMAAFECYRHTEAQNPKQQISFSSTGWQLYSRKNKITYKP